MQWFSRVWRSLELFEVVGSLASIAAGILFFADAQHLDHVVGIPGYHWKMLSVVASIYERFIPYAVVVGGGLLFAISIWMRRSRRDLYLRFLFALRVFLAYCLLLIVFRVVNFYVPAIHPGILDKVIQKIDATLFFGHQVSDWLQPLSAKWLTYALTGAYVSWFWLLFFTIVVLVLVDVRAVAEYVFASLIAFYVGYICYMLVPVIGPGYTLHYAVTLGGLAPVYTTHRLLIARDCFPSLHTAISVLMVIYVWRYNRRWIAFYLPMAALIIFATLYLRIHYGADDLAGAILAVLASRFAPVCTRAWERLRTRRGQAVDMGAATEA